MTFLQATKRARVCQEAKILNAGEGLHYECLSQKDFIPEVVESTPYEPMAQALVAWANANPERWAPLLLLQTCAMSFLSTVCQFVQGKNLSS